MRVVEGYGALAFAFTFLEFVRPRRRVAPPRMSASEWLTAFDLLDPSAA